MAPPSLPQEIIDKIIDEFSETARWDENRTTNKRALAFLSMVARAWRGRSQKHLFSVIEFRKPSSMDVTEATLAELGRVFSFTRDLDINGRWEIFSRFDSVTTAFLRCFRTLDTLSLTGWDSRLLNAEQLSTYFRHFGETVTSLILGGEASAESLIFLTSMFPRLRSLQIFIAARVDGETRGIISNEELPTTGSFQGSLFLWGLSEQHRDFLAFLASTSPKFKMIYINNCESGDGLGELFDSSAATLESLSLHPYRPGAWVNQTSLSKCTQLRKFSTSHPWSESTALMLQTIRSPNLKKLVVHSNLWNHRGLFREEDIDEWTVTDNELCEAYDQWARHITGKMEVIFDAHGVPLRSDYLLEGFREDLERFLPRSIEKVTMVVEHEA